jgi:hypothetical protein
MLNITDILKSFHTVHMLNITDTLKSFHTVHMLNITDSLKSFHTVHMLNVTDILKSFHTVHMLNITDTLFNKGTYFCVCSAFVLNCHCSLLYFPQHYVIFVALSASKETVDQIQALFHF